MGIAAANKEYSAIVARRDDGAIHTKASHRPSPGIARWEEVGRGARMMGGITHRRAYAIHFSRPPSHTAAWAPVPSLL
eukprot:scaffold130188_cov28-Tisochrysis_lutea.AAC.7